jgi:hypothetical protein
VPLDVPVSAETYAALVHPDDRHLIEAATRDGLARRPIEVAVVHHCKPSELERNHPHYRLTSLLKDADGLDHVRLGDLNPAYLRNPQALDMVGFAQILFDETDGVVPPGPGHFAALWSEAMRTLGRP